MYHRNKILSAAHPPLNPTSSTNIVIAKGDSGASSHYLRSKDKSILSHIIKEQGPPVTFPNNVLSTANQSGQLPFSNKLSASAKKAMILPELQSSSLVSLGQLCDDNCTVVLDKKYLHAIKKDEIILRGYRNSHDGLWDIPLQKTSITTNNCRLPTIVPSLYATRKVISEKAPPSRVKIKKSTKTSSLSPPIFRDMEHLFQSYEDDYHINNQLRRDQRDAKIARPIKIMTNFVS